MLPSPDILNDYPMGKFVLSNLAAKRAKQLSEGAPALVHIDSRHPLTIALAEIAAGKIKPIMNASAALDETEEMTIIVGDGANELGALLPGLEEDESLIHEDDEALLDEESHEEVIADEVLSLSDLVGEEDEVEVEAPEDDTLSLSDVAEQETIEEEGSEDES